MQPFSASHSIYRPVAWLLLLIPALPVLAAPGTARAATVSIPASKDNTLFQDSGGALSSGAGSHFFSGVNTSLNVRRGVIAFDVAAYLPEGVVIDSVALVLNVSSAPNDIPQPVTLHRVLADWGEGASVSGGGAGAPSAAGDATWLHTFYPDQFWTSAGGDFAAAASATQTVGVSGPHVWSSAGMVADVQAWLATPTINFGWLLQGNEAGASTVRRFDARENPDTGMRPFLFVSYSPPNSARQSTWGGVKAIYRSSPK